MVGRLVSFYLRPFNFSEFLLSQDAKLSAIYNKEHFSLQKIIKGEYDAGSQFKNRIDAFENIFVPHLEHYCLWGGYPAVSLAARTDVKNKLLHDIYNNFVLKDIKGLLELATDRELLRLSEYLATQIGNIVVYKNLSNAAGLDFRSMKKHLYILEETFIVKFLYPFFRNKQKELSKNPKVYFEDLGFRNYLMNNFNPFAKRADAGALAENFAFVHLQSLCDVFGKLNFWQAKSEAEVDFLLEKDGGTLPIEIKFAAFKEPKVSRSLVSYIQKYSPSCALILNKNFWGNTQMAGCRVLFAPLYFL
jgi:hypothetical protein